MSRSGEELSELIKVKIAPKIVKVFHEPYDELFKVFLRHYVGIGLYIDRTPGRGADFIGKLDSKLYVYTYPSILLYVTLINRRIVRLKSVERLERCYILCGTRIFDGRNR